MSNSIDTPADQQSVVVPLSGRRHFMGTAGVLAVGGALIAKPAASDTTQANDHFFNIRSADLDQQLKLNTYRLRIDRAKENFEQPLPPHHANGDEERYGNKIGSDTRGLPHDARGEVDPAAWATLQHALSTRNPADFDKVVLGGTRKLVNPLGTLALNLTGASPNQIAIPPAPTIASAEKAAEAIELYWQSLLRDVPFHEYRNDTRHPLVRAAAAEIDKLPAYAGPRDASGRVTPELLFRGTARYLDPLDRSGHTARHVVPPGVAVGPYISQFALLDAPYGVSHIPALISTQLPGNDFLGHHDEWLSIQNGKAPTRAIRFDPVRRHVSTGRDLAEFARGAPGFWSASQILGTPISTDSLRTGGIGAPLNPTNPYLQAVTTSAPAAGSFALGYVQSLLPLGTARDIRGTYWLKWFVHRVPRPEAYGGLVHHRLVNKVGHPLHPDILQSEALARSHDKFGSHLLTSAYPEGAPNHSSYPGGASSSSALHATLLKAFFDERAPFPNPVQPDPNDPTRLIPYTGPTLTIGGELNKLAANIGTGRNWAGIHWRSDAAASLPLAEETAISLLRDEKLTFREPFEGFRFTRFDGSTVVI
ncbi:MAG: twin-arginine translocation pathway signal protein [Aquabacterium sp.]